jgi:hypothetical protein
VLGKGAVVGAARVKLPGAVLEDVGEFVQAQAAHPQQPTGARGREQVGHTRVFLKPAPVGPAQAGAGEDDLRDAGGKEGVGRWAVADAWGMVGAGVGMV